MHHAEVKVNFSALMVSLLKAQMWDAAAALKDWAIEYLYDDDIDQVEHLEEELDIYGIID